MRLILSLLIVLSVVLLTAPPAALADSPRERYKEWLEDQRERAEEAREKWEERQEEERDRREEWLEEEQERREKWLKQQRKYGAPSHAPPYYAPPSPYYGPRYQPYAYPYAPYYGPPPSRGPIWFYRR
jgi:hypothetical protein